MAQYDITDAHDTTPKQSFHYDPTDDGSTPQPPKTVPVLTPRSLADRKSAAEIEQLLATLEAIPREELPEGSDRRALAMLIRYGLVDNLYKPFGADYHNIAWASMSPQSDPRQRVSDWLAVRYEFWSKPGLTGLPASLKPIAKELGYDVGE